MGAAGVRLRAAAVTVVAALALVSPTAARAEPGPAVGGEALGSKGVVAGRGAGVPPVPNVSAQGWLVADADTGEVLAARNAHGRFLPASTIKTLTAVALLPHVDVNEFYVAKPADVNIEGSKVGLVAGTRYPVGKLVEAMLVVSGNDAATALASAAGGLPQAVAKMNATARKLQAFDTTARNPSGLDAPGQFTSPYDLALINRAGLAMPQFAKYVTTLRDSMPAPGGHTFEIYNHNKLLTRYPGNIGVKTGYTIKARHTYVGAARRNGRTIIVTLMKAETTYPDAVALLDWGFRAAGKAVPVGRLVDPVPDVPVDEQADRSRAGATESPAPHPVAQSTGTGSRRGRTVPAAAGLLAVGGAVMLRRRTVLRRRRYGPRSSAPKLRLPVR